MRAVATLLFFAGAAAVAVSLWWVHHSLGLGFAGCVAIVTALGIQRLANDK